MRLTKLLFILLFFSLLTSCATVSEQSQLAQNDNMSWDARVKALSQIKNWNLKGSMGIRQASNAVTANIVWQQQQQNYHISLFGPLGTYSYELTGRPGSVDLAAADGRHFHASTPEALLAEQAGWQLPVSNLYYWVRGLPVPNMPAQKQLDGYNHLTVLNQQGWTIRYLRYTSTNGMDLPSKIFLENPQLNVKIVISQWQIN